MKKTAFAVWMNRIAPVMDVAGTVCVVEADGPPDPERKLFVLPGDHPSGKAMFLRDMGVEALVCGAISSGLLRILNSQGMEVVPFVAGDLETVIRAWFDGRLPDSTLLMPGCGGSGRFGKGGGRIAGNGRMGQGRSEGICICPACGHREPHMRGIPCIKRHCPTCGSEMARKEGRRQ
ncbi:MAG: NifB/NifX family molybdenum-iron cluster-binding protein [Candidatus Fermentibacteraceae bacterium]